MSQSHYVGLRVWGDFACFTRPEMKVERVSYPVMTPSAARGVLEAVYWEPEMYYVVDQITVVRKGRWFTFRRNEVQKVISLNEARRWMRGSKDIGYIHAGGGAPDAAQRNLLGLAEVEYVVSAQIGLTRKGQSDGEQVAKYVERFRKRAAAGKCFHRPALGCREFVADFDLVEDGDTIRRANWPEEDLGLILYDVFDPAERPNRRYVDPRPVFFKAFIRDAVLDCHPDRVELVRPAILRS